MSPRPALLAAVLSGAACLPLLATPAPALPGLDQAGAEHESLEQLLERYRAQRERVFQKYRATIHGTVMELESAYEHDRKQKLEELRGRLVQLGSQAAPLLVELVDPGPEAEEKVQGRSREVARALSRLSTRSVTLDLLRILRQGSKAGQENALLVLSRSDDPERVGPVLREMFVTAHKDRRGTLISAIANLGGADNLEFLGEVLSNQDPDMVRSALVALTERGTLAAAPRILALIEQPVVAAPHVERIVEYYRACPEVVDTAHCQGLVDFAQALRSNSKMAELVLFLVSEHEEAWNSQVRRDLKDLAEARSKKVSQAALICLAKSGDNRSKKALLEPYDERVEKNERIASSWSDRAEVKYRIGEYKSAIKDYEQAQRVASEYQRSEPEVYEGLARCYALLGKLKDAARWLGEGGLSLARLHQLARDPDFAELVEDEKYRKVFRLGED